MKTYTLLTKPYKIQLRAQGHKMKHELSDTRWIDFQSGTEMWCCKVECDTHSQGVSLMVFNHSWMTTFQLDSIALKKRWSVNDISKGDWKMDLSILNESYPTLNITNI